MMNDLNTKLRSTRVQYSKHELRRHEMNDDPVLQFQSWFSRAFEHLGPGANAMTLATMGTDNMPDARIVLLKSFSNEGFTFYTNYQSKKAADIAAHPAGALLFFWPQDEQQVRIRGKISRVPEAESSEYFLQRPFESQVSAWTSKQSSVVEDRAKLEKLYAENLARFKNEQMTRPREWGGYVLVPEEIEFWQGRADRLHDRILYHKVAGKWELERLMP